MSQAIDTNILLYASDTSSPFHKKAKEFINSLLTGPELLYLAWPVIMGYLRIATHPSVFDEPLSPEEAMENIETLLELPHVRLLSEQDGFWLAYRKAAENTVVRGNLVPDAHLAALLLQHGVKTISTHDRDYQRFPFINTRDPFPPPRQTLGRRNTRSA
jgi:toxin-antitoxin system PIN domain toxin